MTLGELIESLEKMDPAAVPPVGFGNPHSYRGYYEDIAFEPMAGVTFGQMLESARRALGGTFVGWKGGEFVMGEHTTVWLSRRGYASGEAIGPILLSYMEMTAKKPERTAE